LTGARDCWEFGADGSFDSYYPGTGSWQLEFDGRRVARWSFRAPGWEFEGFSLPATGQLIVGDGTWSDFVGGRYPFIATGHKDPNCVR
jgi:hypothetical protein